MRIAAKSVLVGHDESLTAATITVVDGKIASIESGIADADIVINDEHVLLPGLIDTHVHLNQPGRTEWEGFETGTLAAVSGGVTTLIDMPLNSIPPTTTVENLETKRREAKAIRTDVGFWGGIIPGNAGDLKPLLEVGVKGFKCFLCESGVDEFPRVDESDLVIACDALEGTNALVLFHAELGEHVHPHASSDAAAYSTFLSSRPASLELSALDLILSLCRRYPSLRFHIVHLSAAEAVPVIQQARRDGLSNLTVETCFHYLTLSADDIPANATQFKCCPPIRSEANRRALIKAVEDGTIDYVVSDHSPCVPELKKGDFMSAWGGISGLGLGLPLLNTYLDIGLPRITHLLASRQAAQVGLQGRKGAIAVGADADFVVFDPSVREVLQQDDLLFRNKVSPYVGKELQGKVLQTWIRGEKAWDAGAISAHGQCL